MSSLDSLGYNITDMYLLRVDCLMFRVILIQRFIRGCLEWKRINKQIPTIKDVKEYIIKPFFVTVNKKNLDIANHLITMVRSFDSMYIAKNFVRILSASAYGPWDINYFDF